MDEQMRLRVEMHMGMQAKIQMKTRKDMEMEMEMIRNEDGRLGSGYAYGNSCTSTWERSDQDRGLHLNLGLNRC
jgi:hypothetical protein